jgi:hypothetical protein
MPNKSQIVQEVAAANGIPVIDVPLSTGFLASDFMGLPVVEVTAGPEKTLDELFAEDEAHIERLSEEYFYQRGLEM